MEDERKIQELTSALKTLKLQEAELTAQLKKAIENKEKKRDEELVNTHEASTRRALKRDEQSFHRGDRIWIKNKLHKPATWNNKIEWNEKEGKTATVTEVIVRGPGEQVHFLTDNGVHTSRTGTSAPATARTGGQGTGRGGRNRTGATSGRGQQGRTSHRPTRTNFKGDTEGMNANVFECFEEQTDRRQFTKTLEALEAYVKKNLKFAEDMTALFADEMEEPQLELPTELDPGASIVEKAIWDEELRDIQDSPRFVPRRPPRVGSHDHPAGRQYRRQPQAHLRQRPRRQGPSEEDRQNRAYDKTFAIALVTGADPSKYGTLIAHLSNQYAMGRDEYPCDETAAYNLLVNYRTPENAARPRTSNNHHSSPATPATPAGSGITFAQHGAVAGNNGLTHDGIECYHCHSIGHYASNCPTVSDTTVTSGTTLTQYAYMLAQAQNASGIDPEWILLDSQSTISVFNNASMLTNIRKSDHTLRALTNGGHQDSDMIGDFHNLGAVWYNPHSIANILSLADVVRKVCRVTLDTSEDHPSVCTVSTAAS
ncbi:hypothetical protein MHU86_7971 [Fragilaria crotonensis]|nr:hypothetical protein MHU86_7971 [Fragilaria crotonensis]